MSDNRYKPESTYRKNNQHAGNNNNNNNVSQRPVVGKIYDASNGLDGCNVNGNNYF